MEYRENRDVRRPFLATPDSRVYFPASTIERARQTTERCLRRGEGIALVVGATGVGKTILSRFLAASFEANDLVVVASPLRKNDVKSFWQQVLFGLRQTFCGCDETELRLMTFDYLERSQRRRFVLIIDDAQNLSFRVFDEIRVLVDQGPALSAQISVALVGSNLLEERLNLPQFYPIQQRIAVRSFLDVFERGEINDYLDREMERVGLSARFSSDAKDLIGDLSEGSPRVVNQLCDRALVLAFPESVDFNDFDGEIGRVFVERAWANLQNLPEEKEQISSAATVSQPSDVVEFGTLDDEEENAQDKIVVANDRKTDERFGLSDSFEKKERSENAGIIKANENNENNNKVVLNDQDGENVAQEEQGNESADKADLIPEVKIDWEEERYGSGSGNETKDETEIESRTDALSTEIDSDLEARLLAKFSGSTESSAAEIEDDVENETNENDKNDFATFKTSLENDGSAVSNDDVVSEQGDEERNVERKVFHALKSTDFEQTTRRSDIVEQGEGASDLGGDADFSSLFSRAKTRRPTNKEDDGSREFEAVNGFSVDDPTIRDPFGERFWEASLSSDSVSGQTVYSDESGRNIVENSRISANNDGEYLSLEDRAYRQIVEDYKRTTSDLPENDQYLTELSLLEQEIEEEVHLVRKIRNIHLKLRTARGEKMVSEMTNREETSKNTNDKTLAFDDKIK